jgi:sulfite reductase alpha subunit-like flavoprotein
MTTLRQHHHNSFPFAPSPTCHADRFKSNEMNSPTGSTLSVPDSSNMSQSPRSSGESLAWSDRDVSGPPTPATDAQSDGEGLDTLEQLPEADGSLEIPSNTSSNGRRASTTLISENAAELRKILGDGETGTQLIEKYCCGGGCCLVDAAKLQSVGEKDILPIELPNNDAFQSLKLALGPLSQDSNLSNVTALPNNILAFESIAPQQPKPVSTVHVHPPKFVQPHPPYEVFSAPIHHARELTKPGALKRTFHFDLDVTDYPDEGGVDFRVGGAIGICPPNDGEMVDEIFTLLGVPSFARDKPITLKTQGGRWPTIWGEDEARQITTTRRELLTWCSDVQSTPPTKALLRVLAEYATAPNEKQILNYLCSAEGQASFCDLRTGPHITLAQLLHAFPSSQPPLDHVMSVLPQIMPRFYSLSNDPHISSSRPGLPGGRRLIEMAVTIHETPNWRGGPRTGIGSGYMERMAKQYIAAEAAGEVSDFRVPMFRGLMANPLSARFASDGPMMLIGAGVGMAPFRGFILNRLKNATCANKIWLVQGVRDAALDALYSGELGVHEDQIKHLVQSRASKKGGLPPTGHASKHAEARYVQDEVRLQADIVWFVINALDGRIFVCGSSKGMGEGVEEALIDVVMEKANLNRDQAQEFWNSKKEDGQYITVSPSPTLTAVAYRRGVSATPDHPDTNSHAGDLVNAAHPDGVNIISYGRHVCCHMICLFTPCLRTVVATHGHDLRSDVMPYPHRLSFLFYYMIGLRHPIDRSWLLA